MTLPLRESMEAALSWLSENQAQYCLGRAASPEHRLKLIKPLGELALTAAQLLRSQTSMAWASSTLQFAWSELREGEELVAILAARPDLIVATSLYGSFYTNGLRNGRLEHLIEYLASCAACENIEFPAWRRLDVAHGFAQIGLRPFPADPERATWLAALPEPWMISEDIAYAVTHEIFYITDFGHKPERLKPDLHEYVVQWLPAWCRMFYEAGNLDLFAEFLMVAGCVRLDLPPQLGRLIEAQHGRGYFPGPKGSAAELTHDLVDPSRVAFLQNYHTTLVSVMALSYGISAQSAPPGVPAVAEDASP